MLPGFWSGIVRGALRVVECPHCRHPQRIARRPPPFDASCTQCRRTFRVTTAGAVAIPKD
jgi:ribosomal protein S27E